MKTLNKRLMNTTEKMKDVVTMKQQQQHVGDNKYEMGTKTVEIDENSDIIVDGVKYDGTTGLWALFMMNDQPESCYTRNDLHMYKDLVYRPNVTSHPHNVVLGKDQKVDAYISTLQPLVLRTIILIMATPATTMMMQLFKNSSNKQAG